MAVLDILKFPDPRLRNVSTEIKSVTPEVVSLAQDLIETMYNFHGIGLSAPQVGSLTRLLVTDTRPQEDSQKEDGKRYEIPPMTELEAKIEQPLVIINPVIREKRVKTTYEEGCLSVPGYFEMVERYNYVEVEGLNARGQKITIQTDGLLSICIQHEIDHLDGKLFIDRLSLIKSNRIKSKIKKWGYPVPKPKEDSTNSKDDTKSEDSTTSE